MKLNAKTLFQSLVIQGSQRYPLFEFIIGLTQIPGQFIIGLTQIPAHFKFVLAQIPAHIIIGFTQIPAHFKIEHTQFLIVVAS